MEDSALRSSREATFLSQLALIGRVTAQVCQRNHLSGGEADDFASHVKLKLIEHDYAILGKFQGRSSLQTYLTIVIHRLFLDYRISAWGKWRPSAEAKRRGPVAILLEQLLVRDGCTFDQACETLTTNHRLSIGRAELEQIASALPARTRRRLEGDDVLAHLAARTRPTDAALADIDNQAVAERLSEALRQLISGFDAQDRLIIVLRFEDGRSVADIATTLRLDQKALYRRFERLLRQIRAGLEAEGLDASTVMEILGSPAVHIDWSGGAEKEGMVRL